MWKDRIKRKEKRTVEESNEKEIRIKLWKN